MNGEPSWDWRFWLFAVLGALTFIFAMVAVYEHAALQAVTNGWFATMGVAGAVQQRRKRTFDKK